MPILTTISHSKLFDYQLYIEDLLQNNLVVMVKAIYVQYDTEIKLRSHSKNYAHQFHISKKVSHNNRIRDLHIKTVVRTWHITHPLSDQSGHPHAPLTLRLPLDSERHPVQKAST